MSAPAPPPADAKPAHPWWAPLLGMGSLGMGGLQALGGLALVGVALSGPADSRGAFLLLGTAWFLPGILLGASGVLVTLRSPWGRAVSVAAVLAGSLGIGLVAANRTSIPPAMAETGEWAVRHPEAPPWAKKLLDDVLGGKTDLQFRALREPSMRSDYGWLYAGYCGCPVIPWYLTLLLACAGPWARRLSR